MQSAVTSDDRVGILVFGGPVEGTNKSMNTVKRVSILLGVSERLKSLLSGPGGQETRLVSFSTGVAPGCWTQKRPNMQGRDGSGRGER